MVKEELLNSVLETEDQYDLDLEKAVKRTNDTQEVITIIQKYEDILKSKNNRIINIAGDQGLLLKRFKEEDGFLDTVGLSQSHAYFKI